MAAADHLLPDPAGRAPAPAVSHLVPLGLALRGATIPGSSSRVETTRALWMAHNLELVQNAPCESQTPSIPLAHFPRAWFEAVYHGACKLMVYLVLKNFPAI